MSHLNNVDQFLGKIAQGRICIGCGVSFSDPLISEMVAAAGFDFSWIDLEHSALSLESAMAHVMVLKGTGAAPFIRVPWNDPVLLKPVLEMVPAGVIIPKIRTGEEARQAVAACKYPPAGVRGFGPRRGIQFGAISTAEYLKNADQHTLVMLQIEHVEGLRNIEDILKTPGVDGVCVGPNDLSGSMGKLGQMTDPEVRANIVRILQLTRQAGKLAGIAGGFDAETTRLWMRSGAQWLTVIGDWAAMFMHCRSVVTGARAIEQSISSAKPS